MASPEKESYYIDYSKISPETHEFAKEFMFAVEAQPFYQASVDYWHEKKQAPELTVEQLMEADIEYTLAHAESMMNMMILLDKRSREVADAIINNNYRSEI